MVRRLLKADLVANRVYVVMKVTNVKSRYIRTVAHNMHSEPKWSSLFDLGGGRLQACAVDSFCEGDCRIYSVETRSKISTVTFVEG